MSDFTPNAYDQSVYQRDEGTVPLPETWTDDDMREAYSAGVRDEKDRIGCGLEPVIAWLQSSADAGWPGPYAEMAARLRALRGDR